VSKVCRRLRKEGNDLTKLLLLYDDASRNFNAIDIPKALQKVAEKLRYDVSAIQMNGGEIRPCYGCNGCWTKTPGICVITNDCVGDISRQYIRTDVVVLLSEITYGGFSPDIKVFLDRNISHVLPFFTTHNGEMHHPKRYEHYPCRIAFGYGNVSEQERKTFFELERRNTHGLRPDNLLTIVTTNSDEWQSALTDFEAFLSRGTSA